MPFFSSQVPCIFTSHPARGRPRLYEGDAAVATCLGQSGDKAYGRGFARASNPGWRHDEVSRVVSGSWRLLLQEAPTGSQEIPFFQPNIVF